MNFMNKRVVVKLGTNVLTANQKILNRALMKEIVGQIAKLLVQNWQVVLVTSGAVAAGREVADFSTIGVSLVEKQMYAAVGQARLMREYETLFRRHKIIVGQALLSREDFQDRRRYDNALHAILGLLRHKVVPIINENDVTSVDELSFGDNDSLAAITAIAIEASRLLLLTNQEGLLSQDPKDERSNSRKISVIEKVEVKFLEIPAVGPSKSDLGVGGIISKVKAASLAARAGVKVWIASGLKPENLSDILSGKNIGTSFIPSVNNLTAKERYLLCGQNANAAITIDDGAARALKNRKSLLMVGVKEIYGDFAGREIVKITDGKERIVGFGIVNYPADILRKALAAPHSLAKEVVHVDHLRLI